MQLNKYPNILWNEQLKFAHTEAEKDDIIDLYTKCPSVKSALKKDYTKPFLDDLYYRLYGKIPRNWVINIQGLIGTPTGIFKSALGLCIASALDPTFNEDTVRERVAFTPNQLNELVKNFAERKKVFLLDEFVHDLKIAAIYKLANIVEQCREMQLCFVFCGVPKQTYTFSSYVLERFDESDDSYLPKKRVRYLVRHPDQDRFRGFVVWDIPPLSEGSKWQRIWNAYMELKLRHQKNVTKTSITAFDFKRAAKNFIDKIQDYIVETKTGVKLLAGKLKNDIYVEYADNTKEERNMIYNEIKYWWLTEGSNSF